MQAHLQEGGVLLIQFKPCVASAIMIPHLISEGIKQTSKNHECHEGEEKHLPKLPPQASFSHLTMLLPHGHAVQWPSSGPPTWSPTCVSHWVTQSQNYTVLWPIYASLSHVLQHGHLPMCVPHSLVVSHPLQHHFVPSRQSKEIAGDFSSWHKFNALKVLMK